jgi:5-enolpyruvylshikimate-3-phosphate synthase
MDTIAIPVLNRPVDAKVEITVSKSITNLALLVAALAPSDSILENALFSEDWHLLSLA